MLADLVQEELQAVGDHTGRAQVELAGGLPGVDGLLDLDVGRGKRGPHLVDGVVVELVLELQCLELGSCDHAAVAGLMQEAGHSRIRIQGIRAQSNIRTHQKVPLESWFVSKSRAVFALLRDDNVKQCQVSAQKRQSVHNPYASS